MKKIGCLFLCILCLCLLTLSAFAEAPVVYDSANLLSDKEEASIEAACLAAEQTTGVSFHIVTTTSYYEGDDFRHDFGIRRFQNTVLLIISLDGGTYYYDMYTYGRANRNISDTEVNEILDDTEVYNNLKKGRLTDGCIAFVNLSAETLGISKGAIGNLDIWETVKVGLIISIIGAVIACLVIVGQYKMKIRSTNYPLDKYTSLSLKIQTDLFLDKTVTRRIISNNNSGSHGSSHGGGGGHRGGR